MNKLPFQDELGEISRLLMDLQARVNPESDLFDALVRAEAVLEPFWNDVEFCQPVSLEELDFRRSLQGMKL